MFIYYRGLLVGAKIIILMDNGEWIICYADDCATHFLFIIQSIVHYPLSIIH